MSNGGLEIDGDIAVVTVRGRETTQNATFELLEILSQFATVSLITTALADESEIFEQYEVVEISESGTGRTVLASAVKFALNQLRMCLAIARRDEQVILFFGATSYVVPMLVARLLGRTVIVELRGDVPLTLRMQWEEQIPASLARLLAGVVRLLERFGLVVASAIITYTPAMAEQLRLNRFEHKLYTQGARHVSVEKFRPRTPYEERPVRVGYVGRLDVEKGIPTLVDMVKRLPEHLEFVFVGDGEYHEMVEAELADEIRSGRVEVAGWVDHAEVAVFLDSLKLLVMPSAPTEGLPSTILEAFACGTPVYVTPVAGIPDVVRDGETGFWMTDTDPGYIARRVEQILDRDDLAQISHNCRSLTETKYSFEATVERYREMLDAIVVRS